MLSLQQFELWGGLHVEEPINTVAIDPSSDCFGNVGRHIVPIYVGWRHGPLFFKQNPFLDQMIALFFLLKNNAQIASTWKWWNTHCKSCKSQKQPNKPGQFQAKHHWLLLVLVKKSWLQQLDGYGLFVINSKKSKLARNEIERNSIFVNEALEKDLLDKYANTTNKVTPYMKVLWEQMRKVLSISKFGRRYHNHIIRCCLSFHAKSLGA